MPYKEPEIKKIYFTIGEVSKKLNVSTSLLRFWETEFDTLRPRKDGRGNRLYTEKDIEHLKTIHYLVKEKNFTLKGARKKLKENKSDLIDQVAIAEKLGKIRSFLVELKDLV